jgi:hypothetical protein
MTPSNCAIAYRKLSDKRPWNDIRRELDLCDWQDFYQAVKANDFARPVVSPIKRECRA